MFANFESVIDAAKLRDSFGVEVLQSFDGPADVCPLLPAPYIRMDALGRSVTEVGQYGLLPDYAKDLKLGRRTHVAKAETLDTHKRVRDAWRHGQRCIVPAKFVYDRGYPSHEYFDEERGPVAAAIYRIGHPVGIAGIYNTWCDDAGVEHKSFAMLTVNADGYRPMEFIHRGLKGRERRMVVILDPSNYQAWLSGSPDNAKQYLKLWGGEVTASFSDKPKTPGRPRKSDRPLEPDLFS